MHVTKGVHQVLNMELYGDAEAESGSSGAHTTDQGRV
jgi:hypothetical protein